VILKSDQFKTTGNDASLYGKYFLDPNLGQLNYGRFFHFEEAQYRGQVKLSNGKTIAFKLNAGGSASRATFSFPYNNALSDFEIQFNQFYEEIRALVPALAPT
jgi:hypothetical protein